MRDGNRVNSGSGVAGFGWKYELVLRPIQADFVLESPCREEFYDGRAPKY